MKRLKEKLKSNKSIRQDVDDSLHNKESQLRLITSITPAMLTRCGCDYKFKFANEAYAKMLGLTPKDIVGKPVVDIIGEKAFEIILPYIESALKGERVEFEANIPYKDKNIGIRTLQIIYVPDKDEADHIVGWVASISDITEKKQAENAMRQLAAIVESSDDCIISKDLNGVITSWNKGAGRIFGYVALEVIGKSVTILIPQDRQNEEPAILERIRRGERVEHYETIRQRKDGSLVDISLTVSPIKDANGKVIGISKIARDISDRKKAEKELLRSNAELEQFAYIASHDLQEPLHLINSFVGLFVRRCQHKLDPKEKEYLDFIQQGAIQAKNLVKELLEYCSIGKDKTQDVVSLKEVLKEVETNLKLSILESKAEIICNGLPDIKASHLEMVQLFQNLISNAIKYRRETPKIEISVSRAIDVNSWLFSVKDNGIGIDQQFRERIFGMFERLHSSREFSGTGIGLAVCKKIVEHHGGKIWVDSEPGKGSTFHFILNAG